MKIKHYTQKIGISLLLFTLILVNISANKSNWAGMNLAPDEVSNCVRFQLARGGTSLSEFKSISSILNRFITKKYNLLYLKNILGEPNEIKTENATSKLYYYLSANPNDYKLEIVIEKDVLSSYKLR